MNIQLRPKEALSAQAAKSRVAKYDWVEISEDLSSQGCAVIERLLSPDECRQVATLYPQEEHFRSHVHMARHGFGKGEYRYFKYPLPELLSSLRTALYPRLAVIANEWNVRMNIDRRYPAQHVDFLKECHAGGQKRPTPLLLRYGPGDYNCLHRDLYGELVFPLQATILLSEPGRDFAGGEFMLVEQRPRMQSRGEVVPLAQGDAVIFAVNERSVKGTRGYHRTAMRHGVSSLRQGERFTLGVIFHDAA